MALRWFLRSSTRHGKRMVLLVDAPAVKGAVAKGRSSAPSLRLEVMRIAALQMAGGILLKLVYVPSEDNPADAPSRGVVRRWRPHRDCIAHSKKQVRATNAKLKRAHADSAPLRRAQRNLKRYGAMAERLRRVLSL